jgi:hypothetical protein
MQPATLCYVDFASLAQCSSSVADFIASGKSRNFVAVDGSFIFSFKK